MYCWKKYTKDGLKKVARYKWYQAKYDLKPETFSAFLKQLKDIAKQTF